MIGQERGELEALIQARVLAGTLPKDMPRKIWAGYGSGKVCSACDQTIMKALDIEYDTHAITPHCLLALFTRATAAHGVRIAAMVRVDRAYLQMAT